MRTYEDNGVVLEVPNLYSPILGVQGWWQRCTLSGTIGEGWTAQWTERGEGIGNFAVRAANISYYIMGLLPRGSAEPEFRQYTVNLTVKVFDSDYNVAASFEDIEVNLYYGSVAKNASYFAEYPLTFAWNDMEFVFSAPFNFSHKIQYAQPVTEEWGSSSYPDAGANGFVNNILQDSFLCAHRIQGEQGDVEDINAENKLLFDVEGLRYSAANAELIPVRYSERHYRGAGGADGVVSGGGYAFFEIKLSTMPDSRRISLNTLDDWNYSLPILCLYDDETLGIEGEVLDPDTGEWIPDTNCYVSLTSRVADIAGTHYHVFELRNLSENSHYWLKTTEEPYVPEPRGTSMIFSEASGFNYDVFLYEKTTMSYPTNEVVEQVEEVVEGSGMFLPLARQAGVISDLGSCPDLTLKWIDEAGYVWSLPFFEEKISADLGDKSEAIALSSTNRIKTYGGQINLSFYSPVMSPAELRAVRSIARSPFYAACGRALAHCNYGVSSGAWYFVDIVNLTYEWTKKGGRIALELRAINTNDVDSIAKQMFVQNLARK